MAKKLLVPKKTKRVRVSKKKISSSLLQFMDMNDDCLTRVFEFLDVVSLIKMCKLGQRFMDIVTQNIIPRKTLHFSEFSKHFSVRKVFEQFGKSMTRIIIRNDDIQMTNPGYSPFAEFLRLLTVHGKHGQLQEVNLSFGAGEYIISQDLLNDARPYFENTHTLIFNLTSHQKTFFDQFMNAIPKHNLRTLTLPHIQIAGKWLTAESLPNLQNLTLTLCQAFSSMTNISAMNESTMMNFISTKPTSLISFECDGTNHEGIFVEVSRHMPNIQRLGHIMCWPDIRELIGLNNNNNNNNDERSHKSYREKWKYLNAFTNLKYFSLRSNTMNFSDCGEVFRIFASKNTIEDLELTCGYRASKGNSVAVTDLNRLTRLKSLNLIDFDHVESDDFLCSLFGNLPALTKCSFSGRRIKQARIVNLLKLARKLDVLVFNCKVTSFSARFYKSLLKIRVAANENQEDKCLVISMNDETVRKCVEDLGKKYKPGIIALKSI